jgi:hypothetical protein
VLAPAAPHETSSSEERNSKPVVLYRNDVNDSGKQSFSYIIIIIIIIGVITVYEP